VAVPVSKKRAHMLQEGQDQMAHGRDIRGLTDETYYKKSSSRKPGRKGFPRRRPGRLRHTPRLISSDGMKRRVPGAPAPKLVPEIKRPPSPLRGPPFPAKPDPRVEHPRVSTSRRLACPTNDREAKSTLRGLRSPQDAFEGFRVCGGHREWDLAL
jgi:hypothetical protein